MHHPQGKAHQKTPAHFARYARGIFDNKNNHSGIM
jgi:hypothetical protein